MRIAFFASGISPHIAPMCDELYEYCQGDFRFFATDKEIIPAMKIMGAENLHKEKTYFVNINESKEFAQMADEWAKEADVAIVGCSNCYRYIDVRFSCGNKLTFKLRERLFKCGYFDENDIGQLKKIEKIKKHKDKNLYFLSAGTYAPYDLKSIGIDENKIVKWGYFPRLSDNTFDSMQREFDSSLELIWFGRFVREKLSLNAIIATKQLISEGYNVHLSMIGYGDEEDMLKEYVKTNNLKNSISFLGPMNEYQIRRHLQKSHIFIMTSNYEEGWGVVVNEAMSEGCVPVVSYATGASQLLIENTNCGKLFYYEKIEDLIAQIKTLIEDKELLKECSKNSYDLIESEWNAKIAVNRLINLINSLQNNLPAISYSSGPCSKIEFFKNETEVNEYIDRRVE
ncbi:MAG: glycosyltransferase [Eubacterium sp.]